MTETDSISYDSLTDLGKSGIVNIGNTCFMNTCIQQLIHIPDIVEYFLSKEFKADDNMKRSEHEFIAAFFRLLKGMWEDNCTIRPTAFKAIFGKLKPQFRGFQQHCSYDALIAILDLLDRGLSYRIDISPQGSIKNDKDRCMIESITAWKNSHICKKNKNSKILYETSKIIDLFYGQTQVVIKCSNCGHTSTNYDPLCSINLAIPKTTETMTLDKCLQHYSDSDILEDYRCDQCNETGHCTKTENLWKLPKYLIVHLKRFKGSSINCGQKINTLVDFPVEDLNLNPYLQGYKKHNSRYKLLSISNHIGNTGGGHYFAITKSADNNWYIFNDQTVKKIPQDKIVTKCAYVLIYQQYDK